MVGLRSVWGFAVPVLLALASCGGGGGGGGGSPSNTPNPPAADYPVVVQSGAFAFPDLAAPPERNAASATIQGRVQLTAGTPPASGTNVVLLDAGSGTVTARTTIAADGSFSFGAPTMAAVLPDRQLRVQLADGTVLRAFAVGWSEVTPGSEVAVAEIQRLRVAGAFSAHAWAASDLAVAQDSLSLRWAAMPGAPAPAQALTRLRNDIRLLAPWNQLLDSLGGPAALPSGYDVAGLYPVDSAQAPSAVAVPGAPSAATVTSSCLRLVFTDAFKLCNSTAAALPEFSEGYRLEPQRLLVQSTRTGTTLIDSLLQQLGQLPLLEFPGSVGTKVLLDSPRITLESDPMVKATARVVRRTYPAGPVAALGGTATAVLVVLDYELAVLHSVTRATQSMLLRQKRWYSPQAGRVRMESARWVLSGDTVSTWSGQVVAQSASGTFFEADSLPSPGVADVRALPLKHRHALYVPSIDRILVATEAAGGTILELDPSTLTTVRSVTLSAKPGRLAASADGTRLYVGMDGAVLFELRMSDLAVVRRTALPADPYGVPYRRIYDVQVDPRNGARALLLVGGNDLGGSGAVMLVDSGALALRDAPVYYATDYGWGYYSPNALRWTSVANEFLAASYSSPKSLYRFSAASTAFGEVARLQRVDEVGLAEADGELLTERGQLLDATTWALRRSLSLGAFSLSDCQRQGPEAATCGFSSLGIYPPFLLHVDVASNAFLGTYRPAITQAYNGCADVGVDVTTLGLDQASFTPMDRARSLVATLPTSDGHRCSLQVWTLVGVVR
jgi:hypothetical protein